MDTRAQMQAIVDKIVGVPPETLPKLSALDEPWRTIYRRATRAAGRTDAEIIVSRATKGLEDHYLLTRDLVDLLPGDGAFCIYPSLHEMSGQFSAVDWLWPSWIPRGQLTLLGAAPGVGKSLVALDLARRIIHDQPFPDGTPVPCPGSNVLIVDAEGAPALLNQRAQAWDIDRRRLYLMLAPDAGGLINLDHPEQQLRLCKMCRHIRPALVIVDSLAAATARGETSLHGARALLGFLSSVARQARIALLLIHHLRKRTRSGPAITASRPAADDLRGSSHISAAARSVLALSLVSPPSAAPRSSHVNPAPAETAPPAPSIDPSSVGFPKPRRPSSPTPTSGPSTSPSLSSPALTAHRPDLDVLRRLEVVKTNLCRQPPPLGLIFEGKDVPVPTLRYMEFDEASYQAPLPPGQFDLCARWLLQYLAEAGAPVKPASVVQAASQVGFSRATLYRARQALQDSIVDLGNSPHDPHKRWSLAAAPPSPEGQSPEDPPPGQHTGDSETLRQ